MKHSEHYPHYKNDNYYYINVVMSNKNEVYKNHVLVVTCDSYEEAQDYIDSV
jgi:hypothetical protein